MQRFETENSRLKDRILELEADLATKSKMMAEAEAGHKREQRRLEKAIQEQASRLEAVEMEFADLKAHPEVASRTLIDRSKSVQT